MIGRSLVGTAVLCAALLLPRAGAAAEAPAVEQAWARPTTSMAKAGGAFLVIRDRGGQGDRLLSAASPVAERTELHTHAMEDGVARMRAVEGGLELPPGGVLEMLPGRQHIMFIGLKQPLAPGTSLPLTLTFEQGGEVRADVRVLEAGEEPPAPAHGHHGHGEHGQGEHGQGEHGHGAHHGSAGNSGHEHHD